MAGSSRTSWLIDSKRFASKIKNASEPLDSSRSKWKSNPSKACPRCNFVIDNTDVAQEWPGLPSGVKFDPTDSELLCHLLAKAGKVEAEPHPFINEFIPTVDEDDGICYTHPQKLPGVKQDGTVSHFFHRTYKAYNTGTRKRRKIHGDHLGDIRWHKTGKTKPVIIEGQHLGSKKIMVLYMSLKKGEKPEKTNWVMHQYHLGTGEDEQDGQFVVSKVFFQQQQSKPNDKSGRDTPEMPEEVTPHVDPVFAPNLETYTQPSRSPKETSDQVDLYPDTKHEDNSTHPDLEKTYDKDITEEHNIANPDSEKPAVQDNHPAEDTKWWEGESQFLLDSQQLADGIALCDEFLQSQSSCVDDEGKCSKPLLADYAQLGVDDLKKDLEECRDMGTLYHSNIELDTPPDFRLSQLEFGSQDSFLAFAGTK